MMTATSSSRFSRRCRRKTKGSGGWRRSSNSPIAPVEAAGPVMQRMPSAPSWSASPTRRRRARKGRRSPVLLACPSLLWRRWKKVFDMPGEFGIVIPAPNGWVAQLVEQGTENPRVRGSTPFPATRTFAGRRPCVSDLLYYRHKPRARGSPPSSGPRTRSRRGRGGCPPARRPCS